MRRKFIIEIGNKTDVGMVRENNQDYYGSYDTINGKLIIVCDGMGGYEGGEIASQMAVDIIKDEVSNKQGLSKNKLLSDALIRAHNSIKHRQTENPDIADMGTTAVALLLDDHQFWYAHAGDSRLYLSRNGKITRLSKDHSLVQQMIDGGIITERDAKEHPKKNIITRALGAKDGTPDVSGPFTAYQGDKFLLCSDGLHDYLNDEEIEKIMQNSPQEASEKLVNLANERGGADNITVQVIEIKKGIIEKRQGCGFLKKYFSTHNLLYLSVVLNIILVALLLNCNKAEQDADMGNMKPISGDSHIMQKEVADSVNTDAQTEGEAIKESDEVKEADNNKVEIDDDRQYELNTENNEMPTRSEPVGNETKKEKGFINKIFGIFTKSKN
ncbi:MAG TPA: Stp1/IreP family PP2C-type Ser/Thr phosphatase [Candidatus Cloacimonadota bacterium]|nr:Stp1/IreP family PP2C-type Ser/Thr phosphatase [Candidatus Cloacimonadota bacterium]HQB41733.1 Stp1/IreP family PP2C-type Ser/Thr phosphatase [Candidatus Cloacimonadota bacterium]